MHIPDLDKLRDLDGMTPDEMQAEFVALAEPFAVIDTRRRMLARAIEAAQKKAAAQARVSAMSPADREALLAALQKDGA